MKKIYLFTLIFTLTFFISCKDEKKGITLLNIAEFNIENVKNGTLIDVRTPEEYAEGHLPNAININVLGDDFSEKMSEIKKNKTVYVYCKSGKRSTKASEILDTLGYKYIYNLDGGFMAWERAGKEIEK